MIADMLNNKKLIPIIIELFIRDRKLKIYLLFITQSYFVVPKDIRLNSTHYFIMNNSNKRKLKQVASHNSSDIDFMDVYKKCTSKPYSFLVLDATQIALDNHLRFRKNIIERIWKLIMTIDDKIRDEKRQYYINREAAKIWALSSGKIYKYE